MKIKKWLAAAATAIAIVTTTTARADDSWWDTRVRYDTSHDPLFKANELSLDLFGTYQAREHHFLAFPNRNITGDKGQWGGGVGVNYFFTRMLGVGVNTALLADRQRLIDHAGADLIVRLPIDAAHVAPYFFGGGGRAYNPGWNWFADVGVGVEFRLNPKLGIFGDARYIWTDHHVGDQAALRSGIRLVF